MNLKIPKEKAINILEDRLSEIDNFNFNSSAWKNKTENDLREIFPLGSTQWLQISNIKFDTYISSEKQKVLNEGKNTARQLVQSYIDFINQYSEINEERQIIRDNNLEEKYNSLLNDWNKLAPDYNKLLKDLDNQLTKNESLVNEIDNRDSEINRIKNETIQLDNVSFAKLFKAFTNLKFLQIISFFSIVIAIIVGAFKLGSIYQRNEDNNQIYDYKTLNDKALKEVEEHKKKLTAKDSEIKKLKIENNSLLNKKIKR